MADTFQSTGVGGSGLPYSNVSRIQLEQIRKADFFSGSKALTVGDSGNNADTTPFTALGQGNINAEQFFTQQSTLLDDVYSLTPNPQPGTVIGTVSQVGAVSSETTQWYGPTLRTSGTTISAVAAGTTLTDTNANFVTSGVQPGDLVLLKAGISYGTIAGNTYSVGAVSSVTGPTTLAMTGINNSFNGNGTAYVKDFEDTYSYVIVTPGAVRLFAYPGSGPTTGEEQTYFTVIPTSTLHSASAPSTGQINADRVTNVVPPNYNLNNPNPLNPSVDSADSIYGIYQPRTTADLLGYRWVVYPDNGSGAPNLSTPITPTSVIDPSAALTGDQRLTFDYKAGIFRLSCAPKLGGAFKVAGGVDPSSGRMNLWAVFWAVDANSTLGSSRQVYALRSTYVSVFQPGLISFDLNNNVWRIGATSGGNDFVVSALGGSEDPTLATMFGALDVGGTYTETPFRGFVWRNNATRYLGVMKMVTQDPWISGDPQSAAEVPVADKTMLTVGDLTSPPLNPGADFNAISTLNGSGLIGARDAFTGVANAALVAAYEPNSLRTVHLRQGRYYANSEIVIPPNTVIEGEGEATKIFQRNLNGVGLAPVFKFGPNTKTGVFDYGAYQTNQSDGQNATPIATVALGAGIVEGVSCVWNPVRRVWAYVFADLSTNTIVFQEVDTHGTTLFSGAGSVIRSSVTLFSSASPNSANHTPCHYPRIAYHEHTDTYAVVWVEQQTLGTVGPVVVMWQFGVNATTTPHTINPLYGASVVTMPVPFSTYYVEGATYVPVGSASPAFFDHPSVCVDTSDTSFGYTVWVNAWGYSQTSGGQIDSTQFSGSCRAAWSNLSPTGYAYAGLVLAEVSGAVVVSSTDIKDDAQGGFFAVESVRTGIPLFSTTGTISVAGGVGTLTDSGLPAGQNFSNYFPAATLGAFFYPKFLYLYSGVTNTGTGYDGYVVNNTTISTSLTVVAEDNQSALGVAWANASGNLNYAIIPRSVLIVYRYTGSGQERFNAIVGGAPTANEYVVDQSEPDFVRCSMGDSGWLVVYQAMNTTGFLSQSDVQNFSGGDPPLNSYFIDNSIALNSTEAFREHISTCAVLVADSLAIISPYQEQVEGSPSANNYPAWSRDIQVSNRSLGARDPITFRPNYYVQTTPRQGKSQDRLFAALNFFFRWNPSAGRVPSMLPDVTWTGSDWVVVSPVQDQIHSKIGFVQYQSLPPGTGATYLTDATFCFGANGPGVYYDTGSASWLPCDGNYLKQTVVPGQDQIYFPSLSLSVTIAYVHSEHTVVFLSNPFSLSPASGILNTEWVLVRANTGTTAGVKMPGFRVAADGRLIVGSDFITMADPAPDLELGQNVMGNKVMTLRMPNSDGHNLPGDATHDYIDDDARILADIGFHGVAVGAPKPPSTALTEQPMVAIAWADTGYGVIQRYCADIATSTSALQFYYQSFGPYSSGLKNMSIVTSAFRSPSSGTAFSKNLQVLSSKKVFTRHLVFGASNVNGNFATDGYRNIFVHTGAWQSGIHGLQDGNMPIAQGLAMMAQYTDVLGDHAIRKQGPSTLDNATNFTLQGTSNPTGLIYPNEFADASVGSSASPTWTTSGTYSWGNPAYNPNLSGTPKVVWDGRRFLAVWIEQTGFDTAPYANPGPGAYICVGIFPGDEDGGQQTSELVLPPNADGIAASGIPYSTAYQNPYPSEIVRVSVGSVGVQTFQFDVATSGNVVAVLWTGGLDPLSSGSSTAPDTTASGGSAVGVAMFDMTSYHTNPQSQYEAVLESGFYYGVGSGTSYFLAAGAHSGSNGYSHPKIIWDGQQFVSTFCVGYNEDLGVTVNTIAYQFIPEHGMARGSQLKAAQGANPNSSVIAVGNGSNSIVLAGAIAQPGGQPGAQPGDLVVFTSGAVVGQWPIQDYNPATRVATLNMFSGASVNFGSSEYTGFIMSIGSPSVYGGLDATLVQSGTTSFAYSQINNLPGQVSRVCGLVYNESRSEYAVLYLGPGGPSGTGMFLGTFKGNLGTFLSAPALALPGGFGSGGGEAVRMASLAWNGRHYLITYITYVPSTSSPGGENLEYMLVSPTCQVIEQGVICSNITLTGTSPFVIVGNSPGTIPGPLYEKGSGNSYFGSAKVQPRFRNTQVVWNDRLNRWVVSLAVYWTDNVAAAVNVDSYSNAPQQFQARSGTTSTSFTYVGTTIITTSAFPVQPGQKVYFVLNTSKTQYAYATVTFVTSTTNFSVDIQAGELGNPSSANYTLEMGFREDVLCFTLGSSAPGVKIHDADNVSLENVTFGGAGADIEERYTRMARPMWQSGGSSAGIINGTTASAAYTTYRANQYNHLFTTPVKKVNMPRYTNVRSTTAMKFGLGTPPPDFFLNSSSRRA